LAAEAVRRGAKWNNSWAYRQYHLVIRACSL
jgi:hypothetical protein